MELEEKCLNAFSFNMDIHACKDLKISFKNFIRHFLNSFLDIEIKCGHKVLLIYG